MSVADPLSGRDLAAFVAAVEAGTVQGAADALRLTQSAVSKRLKALEQRVGQPLLVRTSAGVQLTGAGRRLYPEAKGALGALAAAEIAVRGDQLDPVLRVAASHTIGEFLLPGWLAGFRAAEQGVAAEVEIVNSPGVLAAVRERRAEVGCVEGTDALDDVESMRLLRDEIVVVVAPGHRWATSAEVPAVALIDEPFSTRETGSGTRAVATERLQRAGVDLRPVLQVASTQSLKRAVLQGGFTLLSRLAVEEEVRAGTLAALRLAGVDMGRELHAVRLRREVHSTVARAWWRWLAGVAAASS